MNIQEAIQSRRTAHVWNDTPVPDEVIERGISAANQAPCHRHTWPWRFIIPGPVARTRLFELGVELKANKLNSPPTDALRARLTPKLRHPALVVVAQLLRGSANQREEDYAACACAIQNLSLSALADGFQCKWSTGGLTRDARTYSLLGVDPDDARIVGFVWIGEPTKLPTAPGRPQVPDLVRYVP